MNRLLKWIVRYKGALYISGAYGIAAVLLYILGVLTGGDGSLGVWYWVYFSAWPISHIFNIVVCSLDGFIPDSIFGLLYSASPILAGMLWGYLISRCIFAVRAR